MIPTRKAGRENAGKKTALGAALLEGSHLNSRMPQTLVWMRGARGGLIQPALRAIYEALT